MKHTATLFLFSLLLFACGTKQTAEKIVTVTIEPQRYFAEKIAGNKYTINSMVAAGLNPENYDPTPQQMVNLGKSLAYLKIGYIGFEQAWMNNIIQNNQNLRIFDLSEGFDVLTSEDEHLHEEGNSNESEEDHKDCKDHKEGEAHHHHGGTDPHIWSSISGAKTVARNTLSAFIALDPENIEYYTANYNALLKEIEQTETVMHQALDSLQNRTFIIYHPALTYLAKEFGLKQLCIEMDGKEPSPAILKDLIETARKNNTKVVFIQQEFDQKNAELIAKETGCELIRINPLSYDWNQEMITIANALSNGKAN